MEYMALVTAKALPLDRNAKILESPISPGKQPPRRQAGTGRGAAQSEPGLRC